MPENLNLWVAIASSLGLLFVIWFRRGRGEIANAFRDQITVKALMSAYRAGRYKAALAKSEKLKRGSTPTARYFFYRGSMLHHLGNLSDAEASLREGLRLQEHSRLRALYLNTLASVLMDQERFPEAIACYESAGRAWPERGANLRGIAEVWLRQGREFPLALEEARQAVEIDRRATGMKRKVLDARLGEDLAVLGWATAANSGDPAEVESILAEAFRLCSGSSKSVLSGVHFHAGQAYLALQKGQKARDHFCQAAEIDPEGIHARTEYSTIS